MGYQIDFDLFPGESREDPRCNSDGVKDSLSGHLEKADLVNARDPLDWTLGVALGVFRNQCPGKRRVEAVANAKRNAFLKCRQNGGGMNDPCPEVG